MLDLTLGQSSDCTGLSRRSFLRVGGLASLGLTLPAFLRMKAQTAAAAGKPIAGKSISCILMWMQGGPSHHETMDPKPEAPAEIRGEFGTIPTTHAGIRFGE